MGQTVLVGTEFIKKKKCSRCGKVKPVSEFSKSKYRKDGLRIYCKICDKEKSKQFRKEHPEYHKKYREENRDWVLLIQRECNFLYGTKSKGRNSGYLAGTGICVFCGEIHPFLLELHHPFGRDNPFEIHECANCHCLQHRFPAMLEVTL